MPIPLNVVNLETAKFECTFGRGCDGLCCRNGRPPVDADEAARIEGLMSRVLPLLTPEARKLIDRQGFLSRRIKAGRPMLRVVDGWCVFFNKGCVLHTLGAEDGDAYQYKPAICAIFPLDQNEHYEWFVRQWGYEGEDWDLFCLNPENSPKIAKETLQDELRVVERLPEELYGAKEKVVRG